MAHRNPSLVDLFQDIGRTVDPHVFFATRAADQPSGKGRFAGPQVANQGKHLAACELLAKLAGNLKGFLRAPGQPLNRLHLTDSSLHIGSARRQAGGKQLQLLAVGRTVGSQSTLGQSPHSSSRS